MSRNSLWIHRGFISASSPLVKVYGGRAVERILKRRSPPCHCSRVFSLIYGTWEAYPQNLHHGRSGLGDYRAGGYAEVSAGYPPAGPDRVVFEKLVQILVFGCAYERIADGSCSESTLRRRRDEWIELGVMERLREISLDAYDRLIGLELADLAVDGCITKAPCGGEKAGRSPVDRGKGGIKRSAMVDAKGIPLGTITAPANTHDSPLLEATLDALEPLGELPDRARVHMDCAYDSATTHRELAARWLVGEISEKGKPAPLKAGMRWVVERTNSWSNAHKKLVWCTERCGRVMLSPTPTAR
jgi:hypothetical protein